MHARKISLLLGMTLLAACGSRTPQGGGMATGGSQRATGSGSASAEEVAREARGKVKCPAKIESAARAAGAPVDDVLGVRPGMSWDEAANAVMCSHELLVVKPDTSRRINLETFGQTIRQGLSARFAEPRIEKSSQQIMRDMQNDMMARSTNAVREDMKPGQAKWYVSTMGVPGGERVIAVSREEWFAEGKSPPLAGVEQALAEKYGKPNRIDRVPARTYMTWSYDPLGQPITESSPLYHRCVGNSDPEGGTNFSPDCGVVVVAQVYSQRENPALGRYMQVGVIDQAKGYAAITGTEQALRQLDAQRRAAEVQDAARNADAPRL